MYTISQPARAIIDPAKNGGNEVIEFDGKSSTVAIVTFKFKKRPEFVEPYNVFVMRSGNIQGVGIILNVTPITEDINPNPDAERNRQRKKKRIPRAERKKFRQSLLAQKS